MRKNNHKDQSGLVSIVITVIIMFVLSLTVIGFAKVTRREQRQSLDRQLNSQAYYAAETGVNDAQNYIKGQIALGTPMTTPVTDCNSFLPGLRTINATTSYTCALINPSPDSLKYQNIDPSRSAVVPINNTSASPLTSITITWQATDNSTNFGSCPAAGSFPAYAAWSCGTGGLRVELVPFSSGKTRANLLNEQIVAAFIPQSGGGGSIWASPAPGSPQGQVVAVNCAAATTPRYCSVTITGLSIPKTSYLRIKPMYRAANLVISASDGVTAKVPLTGAQATVDITGKAGDVLKRLLVTVPTSPDTIPFDYALQTVDSLCKLYSIVPPSTVNVDAAGTSDPSCALP